MAGFKHPPREIMISLLIQILNLGLTKNHFITFTEKVCFFVQILRHVFSFNFKNSRNEGNPPRSLTLPSLIIKKFIFSYVIVFHSVSISTLLVNHIVHPFCPRPESRE